MLKGLTKKKNIKTMNIKKATHSQLSTNESKKEKQQRNKQTNKQTNTTGTES